MTTSASQTGMSEMVTFDLPSLEMRGIPTARRGLSIRARFVDEVIPKEKTVVSDALKAEITATRNHSDSPGPDLIGGILGGCRIDRLLGRGAMGEVYWGTQLSLDRPVAIKVLNTDRFHRGTQGPEFTAMLKSFDAFLQEARSIAQLSHPNVVQVHDTGKERDTPYIIMELVDGRTLRDLIREDFIPTSELAVMVMRRAALGIQAAHEQGIVHRDIKPSNILVSRDWQVKVADFGLATPAANQQALDLVVGTPAYMSPEQCCGQGVSKLSDIYALGATFYHFLAGVMPFDELDTMVLMGKQVYLEPTPLRDINSDIAVPLAQVVEQMMKKCPEQRFSSMGDVVQKLDQIHRILTFEQAKMRISAMKSPKTLSEATEPSHPSSKGTPAEPTRSPTRQWSRNLGTLLIDNIRSVRWTVLGCLLLAAFFLGLLAGLRSHDNRCSESSAIVGGAPQQQQGEHNDKFKALASPEDAASVRHEASKRGADY